MFQTKNHSTSKGTCSWLKPQTSLKIPLIIYRVPCCALMSRASGRWTGSEKDESQKIKNKKGKIGVLLLFSEPRHATHFCTFVTATAGIQTPSWNAVKKRKLTGRTKERPMYSFQVVSIRERSQTHQTRSPPRPLHSRSPSPHHISMTTTHTCWWIPHSRISLGGTSVCLRARDERDGEITAEVLWSYKGSSSNKKTSTRYAWTWFLSPPQCS